MKCGGMGDALAGRPARCGGQVRFPLLPLAPGREVVVFAEGLLQGLRPVDDGGLGRRVGPALGRDCDQIAPAAELAVVLNREPERCDGSFREVLVNQRLPESTRIWSHSIGLAGETINTGIAQAHAPRRRPGAPHRGGDGEERMGAGEREGKGEGENKSARA